MSSLDRAVYERVKLSTLWRLGGLSLRQLLLQSISGYRQHQLDARSAQFAFYAMLSLAPLLIVVIATIARLPLQSDDVLESFRSAVGAGMPANVVRLIERQIDDIEQRSTVGLILFGLLLLAIAGSRIFLTISAGLDSAYGVEQRRRFWKAGGLALGLTIGIFLLFLVAMILLVLGPLGTEFITARVEAAWVHIMLSKVVRWGVACGFMLVATSTIYWLMPTAKIPWYGISPGSLFATGGWIVLTQGFRIYVENFGRYNETYGTLGGVVVLLIWLYFTGAVLMMGGQIDSVIHRSVGRAKKT